MDARFDSRRRAVTRGGRRYLEVRMDQAGGTLRAPCLAEEAHRAEPRDPSPGERFPAPTKALGHVATTVGQLRSVVERLS